ncbi:MULTISPECIES: flagellar protein FlgN [unclassified Clostridium]|uniref:flagellar protein FlgN n=1 Tax=unclassified Clostridium TaxID=2614128 RepID=UPI000297B050|nr:MULTISPECIES: flagellar protein FlgN [unclassified Clostridium]EKQ51146.1 MAG: flagellar biosynthesis/type III secretory pathway chaperone [Clostridium sp. Maddingley MBC34-26]
MVNELIKLMQSQDKYLKELLELLITQYNMIMNKDVFGLEGLVDKVNGCAKIIAKQELERRNLIGEQSISAFVNAANNEKLSGAYENMQQVLERVKQQKDTNDILLKQQLLFTNKMLSIMNPNRETKVYNSYGNLSR